MLDWEDIVACRWVDNYGYFDGNIFMRESLQREDAAAAAEILKLLSGLSQVPPRAFSFLPYTLASSLFE